MSIDLINRYNQIVHRKSHTGQDIHIINAFEVRYTVVSLTAESTYPNTSTPVWDSIIGYFYTDDEDVWYNIPLRQSIDRLTLIVPEGDEFHFIGMNIISVDRDLNQPKITVEFKAKNVHKEMTR